MKEIIPKYDEKKGIDLLYRMLRLFPYHLSIDESALNEFRRDNFRKIWKNLWERGVIEKLDSLGYNLKSGRKISFKGIIFGSGDYYHNVVKILKVIFDCLEKIERKPRGDGYYANNEFLSMRHLFAFLHYILYFEDNNEGWIEDLKYNEDEVIRRIWRSFGNIPNKLINSLYSRKAFREQLNEILVYLGYDEFSMNNDGIIRYYGTTAEGDVKKRAYDLLSGRKYENVIKDLDDINDHVVNQKFPDALASCRKGLESFYKRFLLNHGKKTLHDGKNTEDGTVNPLAQTVKNEISTLFNFPSYSKNLETQGFPQLIESSKFLISGLANPGGSHGKSEPPTIKLSEVRTAESYLIMLINILLQFEK